MHDHSKQNLPTRSFLYWLMVPIVLAWLATNYILGAIYDEPDWSKNRGAAPTQVLRPVDVLSIPNTRPENGMVTFWFDDAWASQYIIAEPLLSKKGFKGALAVPTSMIGYDDYLNWPQVRTLQRKGWEITNHTVHHDCAMNAWDEKKVAKELQDANMTLLSQGLFADNFVSPCGITSEVISTAAKKQFLTFRGVEPGYNDLNDFNPYDLRVRTITNETSLSEAKEWITYAHDHNLWLIFVFHQIHGKNEQEEIPETENPEKYSVDEDRFTAVVDYVDKSGMLVVVPNQALLIKDAYGN